MRSKMKLSLAFLLFSFVGALTLLRYPRYMYSDDEALQETYVALRIAAREMTDWVAKNGRLPSSAEGLSVLQLKLPLVDGWGCPLMYRPNESERGGFFLYSTGPNCKDDNGEGDDVKLAPAVK